MEFKHKSVLLDEAIEGLNVFEQGVYIDGTLGGAGHSLEIAQRLNGGRLIGIDRDEDAIAAASKRLKPYEDKVTLVHSNFENICSIAKELELPRVDGILLDLGVSSYQLDNRDRGFSYLDEDARLDMRMDRSEGMTAADIINSYSKEELSYIFKAYGEERFANKIAANIIKERAKGDIDSVGALNQIIYSSIPKKSQLQSGNPCKRTYQALRIELNRELKILEDNISDFIDLLSPGGRICIITFHSLEDRIVKNAFRDAMDPCTCPKDFPVCVCGKKPKGRVITRKPILPSEEEMEANRRSKSAKLRIFERK